MRCSILLAVLLAAFSADAKERVMLFGRGVEQEFVPEYTPCDEGPEVICMEGFVIWTIAVKEVVSGRLKEKKVRAVHVQHSKYVFARKQDWLYVLTRIEDEETRKKFGVEYWLNGFAEPETLYCMPSWVDDLLKDVDSDIDARNVAGNGVGAIRVEEIGCYRRLEQKQESLFR